MSLQENLGLTLVGRLAKPASILEPPSEILDLLPLAVYACAADGRMLWVNSRAAELWGREPRLGEDAERFCGSYRLFFSGKLAPLSECPMADVLRTGIAVRGAEGKIERPDGSTFWAAIYIEPVRSESGELLGAINCFHETTALHHQPDELDDFFENSPVALHLVSRNGTIQRTNRAELQMLGYSPEEYIGKNIVDFHVDNAAIEDILTRLLNLEHIEQRPARLRCKDGSIRDVLITSNPRVLNGQVINTRCVTIDVTEKVQAQRALDRRMEEQAALHQFSKRLERAHTLQEVYEAALDAITLGMRCKRASILLFDQTKTMRFVAWRSLSEGYRQAVDGHSPWSADTINPAPITIEDIHTSELPAELKQTIIAEGIAALAFLPLLEGGRLLGKFMVYYDRPHSFGPQELETGRTLGRQLGFSIERLRSLENMQHYTAIVESSEDAIISKNLDGVIKSWNRGAETLLGYTAGEIIGKPITVIIPPERQNEEPQILARLRRGEKIEQYETVRRRKDGQLLDVSITVSPVRDSTGSVIGASKILSDISARKEAEAKLRASEKNLQDLLDAIPAAIYTTDARGRITYFNQASVALAGRTPTVGGDEWCVTWKLYWPDGTPLPHDECPMAIALKEGRPVRNVEALAERPDGSRVPFIPFPTPLRASDGKIVGAVNMLVDISERKQAESNQRILLNELNHRVKNNMQVMQALLQSAARNTNSPEARSVLDDASHRISAMAAAQRVLYGTTGATHFKCEEFLPMVCKAAEEIMPNVTITCDLAMGELPNDMAMPLALSLNELIMNASKHAGVDSKSMQIRVGLTKEDEDYLLFVEDSGPGFDYESVRKNSSGLRLVQGLAQQLRGEFSVTMNPTRCAIRFS
jgi:PAS domain S-box-containing protein